MKKLSLLATAVLLGSVSAPALAAGDLTGTPVTITLLYPDLATTYAGPATAIVGPTVEFPAGTFAPAFGSFDLTSSGFTFVSNQSGAYGSNVAFNGYRLDFSGRTIANVTQSGGAFTPLNVTFSGSSIFINVTGQDPQNGNATFDVSSSAVPEPATWAMMLLGFGMVGFGLRSRRNGKVTTRIAYA